MAVTLLQLKAYGLLLKQAKLRHLAKSAYDRVCIWDQIKATAHIPHETMRLDRDSQFGGGQTTLIKDAIKYRRRLMSDLKYLRNVAN